MEKMKMQSRDMVGSNVEKIRALFPHCVTERRGETGELELAVDFEKLQLELSDDIIGEGEERYQFTWPDKRKAIREANVRTTSTLRPCRAESVDFDTTENLYIEGDNLEVLKVLRETYLGKVKMIYIDPPYNTGNDFVYNDDFAQEKSEFEQNSGLFDEEGNQTIDPMQRNTESNGRFHTDWLNMMYPRLKVARDLLTEDGVIFISIDDNEVTNLQKMCDEVFGYNNQIGCIIRKTKSMTGDSSCGFNLQHENLLIYSRNKSTLQLRGELKQFDGYSNPDNDVNGDWCVADPSAKSGGASTFFGITNPFTGKVDFPPKGRYWAFSKSTLDQYIRKGRIVFKKEHKESERGFIFKRYKNTHVGLYNPVNSLFIDNYYMNQAATIELNSLFDVALFSYPKPLKYIYDIIKYTTNNSSLILDFFSGSATTAHAVMKLNAEDGGNRKFIMVQLPEKTDEKSEAYKAGYKNICEIGKERIRRAGKKVKEEAGLQGENLDTGFRVLKLDSSNMEDVFYTPETFDASKLFVDNVKVDRSSEDLLFQVMLELGVELSAKIESKKVAGKEVYFVDDNYLVACFDTDVNEAAITEIAKMNPVYFVMRDSSMSSDNVADNFDQIFQHYSKDTVRRIL